jgi:hypothetical protein
VSAYDRKAVTPFTDFAIAAVPGFGCVVPELQAVFAFAIPLDCVTSTPLAAGKRVLKKGLPGLGAGCRGSGFGRCQPFAS